MFSRPSESAFEKHETNKHALIPKKEFWYYKAIETDRNYHIAIRHPSGTMFTKFEQDFQDQLDAMYFEVLNSKSEDNKFKRKFIQGLDAAAYYEIKLNVNLPNDRNYFIES